MTSADTSTLYYGLWSLKYNFAQLDVVYIHKEPLIWLLGRKYHKEKEDFRSCCVSSKVVAVWPAFFVLTFCTVHQHLQYYLLIPTEHIQFFSFCLGVGRIQHTVHYNEDEGCSFSYCPVLTFCGERSIPTTTRCLLRSSTPDPTAVVQQLLDQPKSTAFRWLQASSFNGGHDFWIQSSVWIRK